MSRPSPPHPLSPDPLLPPNVGPPQAFQLTVDDLGDDHSEMTVQCVPRAALRAVPAPAKMKATLMQQFDGLEPVLQARRSPLSLPG